MTIKLTKWIHSQRMIVNLQFNIPYSFLNAHEIGLQSNLINCCLYLFTPLYWSKVALQLLRWSCSKLMSIGLEFWQCWYCIKDILIKIWIICDINIYNIQSCPEKHNHVCTYITMEHVKISSSLIDYQSQHWIFINFTFIQLLSWSSLIHLYYIFNQNSST